jgi:hypothetical protein
VKTNNQKESPRGRVYNKMMQKARRAAAEKDRVHSAAGGLNVPPAANWREIAQPISYT